MGSILAKGNDNLNNNNASDRHDIFMDCNSDILSSPSSTLIANHIRQPSIRSRNLQPMPNASELDRRFAKVLVSGSRHERFKFREIKHKSLIHHIMWFASKQISNFPVPCLFAHSPADAFSVCQLHRQLPSD